MSYEKENARNVGVLTEIGYFEKEAHELYQGEKKNSDPPFANCVVRRAERIIRAIKPMITPQKVVAVTRDEDTLVKSVLFKTGIDLYECPACGSFVLLTDNHCSECGQKLDKDDVK